MRPFPQRHDIGAQPHGGHGCTSTSHRPGKRKQVCSNAHGTNMSQNSPSRGSLSSQIWQQPSGISQLLHGVSTQPSCMASAFFYDRIDMSRDRHSRLFSGFLDDERCDSTIDVAADPRHSLFRVEPVRNLVKVCLSLLRRVYVVCRLARERLCLCVVVALRSVVSGCDDGRRRPQRPTM